MKSESELINESIKSQKNREKRNIYRIKNGKSCYEDMLIYPLINGEDIGAVIRIDDVTEKNRLEEMIVQNEKMLSVGGLAAGMAHEIKNPLAGIIQSTAVLANRLIENPEMHLNLQAAESAGTSMAALKKFMELRDIERIIASIKESGFRAAEIIDNMLNFARKSEGQYSSHSIDKLLDKTLELMNSDFDSKSKYDFKKINIVKKYSENIREFPCEGAKIQQVFLNIFHNGAEAMLSSGIEKPVFQLTTKCENNKVIIEIEDNGPGMAENIRKRIFEPFFTTKPEGVGTGLGLSVSYFIITENHHGEMNVETIEGKGTKFIIKLPISNA